MKSLLLKAASVVSRLVSPYPANAKVGVFREAFTSTPARHAGRPTVLAVQSVEDPFYFALFGAILAECAGRRPVRAELVVVRATSGAIGTGWRAALMRSVPMTWILSTQWVRSYRGLAERVAFRSHAWGNPLHGLLDAARSLSDWWRTRRVPGDFDLRVRGVPVGDLISDTYLRFRPSPRFDAADPFVLRLIWQAHRAVRRAQRYFTRQAPSVYLTSYTTYLEHGVPVRVALQSGVPVRSFGSLNRFDKVLSLDDWFHTANCEQYRSLFGTLTDPERRLAEAEAQLRKRLSGGIDAATSYMKVSAYAGAAEAPPEVAGAVVVFLHDFYDSPHIFPDIVFGDFWEWAGCTIETLGTAGIPFWLKPHPNQVELSSDALDRLRRAHPNARILPTGLSNAQLAQAGIACGVTVYGTVAHELAYLGVPSIGCARHPHSAFGFCRTARTRAEYVDLLRHATTPTADAATMRREALTFYYMHNLHGDAEELELRSRFVALWKSCQDAQTHPDALRSALSELRQAPAFGRRIAEMLETSFHGQP